MDGQTRLRFTVVLAVLLAAVWVLLPTFLGKEVQDTLARAAAHAKLEDPPELAEPFPWWVSVLPNRKLNLGLDLQGGIDLTLEVEVDEAVLASVQRDIPGLKAMAQNEGVGLDEVRRAKGAPALLVAPSAGTTLEQVQSVFRRGFQGYAYERTEPLDGRDWLRFQLTEDAQAQVRSHAVEQALETIRERIDETGVKEPSITLRGTDGIDIQLPGETNIEDAVQTVGTTAQLVFVLVDAEADPARLNQGLEAAKAAMGEAYLDDEALSEWLGDNGYVPADRRVLWEYAKVQEAGKTVKQRAQPYVLRGEDVLTGDDINDAQTSSNPQTGEYYVALEFKPRGQAVFAQVTGENVGKPFAIVLDDEVRSAPVIRERINGNASISMGAGNLDQQAKEAAQLALVLRSGALPAPVTVGEVRTVGASLGEQAIREGVIAVLVGGAMVFLFTGWYYRGSGVIANLALAVNVLTVIALMAFVGATLTLPGICGMALTVGMALDCNIIIYERIREELRAGKPVRAALEAGFDRAVVAVLDSNITTLLAGVVLYSYGSGPIKGFAVTLMIGIFTTLFSGVFVTRTLMTAAFGRRSGAEMSI